MSDRLTGDRLKDDAQHVDLRSKWIFCKDRSVMQFYLED